MLASFLTCTLQDNTLTLRQEDPNPSVIGADITIEAVVSEPTESQGDQLREDDGQQTIDSIKSPKKTKLNIKDGQEQSGGSEKKKARTSNEGNKKGSISKNKTGSSISVTSKLPVKEEETPKKSIFKPKIASKGGKSQIVTLKKALTFKDQDKPIHGSIFCLFCDKRFQDAKKATDHYGIHLETGLLRESDCDQPSVGFNNIRFLSNAWVQELIAFFGSKMDITTFNFRGCPVCRLLAPEIEKMERKPAAERDHMASHMQYRRYVCGICDWESKGRQGKNKSKDKTVCKTQVKLAMNCLTPEEEQLPDCKVDEDGSLKKEKKEDLESIIKKNMFIMMHTYAKSDSGSQTKQVMVYSLRKLIKNKKSNPKQSSYKETMKAQKRTLIKHIKDCHLSHGIPLENMKHSLEMESRGAVNVEDLIIEYRLEAVEMLINQSLIKPGSQAKIKPETGKDSIVKTPKEPCDHKVVSRDKCKSLLKPNPSFSPDFKITRKKPAKTKQLKVLVPKNHVTDLVDGTVGRLFPSPPYEDNVIESDQLTIFPSYPSAETFEQEVEEEKATEDSPESVEVVSLEDEAKESQEKEVQSHEVFSQDSLKSDHSYSIPSSPADDSNYSKADNNDGSLLLQLLEELFICKALDESTYLEEVLMSLEEEINKEYSQESEFPNLSDSDVISFFDNLL